MVKVIKFQKKIKKRSGDLKFRPDQHTAAFIIRKQSGASDWFLELLPCYFSWKNPKRAFEKYTRPRKKSVLFLSL